MTSHRLKKNQNLDSREIYLRKFDFGLFTLQKAATTIAFLATAKEPTLDQAVNLSLIRHDLTLRVIRNILLEQVTVMAESGEESEIMKKQLTLLSGLITLLEDLI